MKHYLKKLEDTIVNHWDKNALCDYGGDSFTYAQLAVNIELFKLFFEAAEIKKGDKIAICARNSARWAMTFWGVNANSRVAVPLLADFHPSNINSLTCHSDSLLLFTDDDIWAKLSPDEMPALKAAINVKDGQLLWHRDEAVAQAWKDKQSMLDKKYPDGLAAENITLATDNGSDLAIINYTSGTTGNPKGVMLTYDAMSDTDHFANTHFPNKPGDTVVSMLPLAHMYGLAIEFIHPNVDGVAVHFLGKTPSPTTLLKAMQAIKPYMVVTVPLVMEKVYAGSIKPALEKRKWMLAIPGLNWLVYRAARKAILKVFGGNVQCFIMGGAALNPEAEQCFRKMRLPYTVGYGMTEACPLLGWEWWTKFVPGSCGKPVHELRIDSDNPATTPGEIQARGQNLTTGYYKNPEATQEAFTQDGWFRTGDLGVIDNEGNIFIRGRIKSMILNSSGQNIYPEEIEAVLANCQHVDECLVVDRDGKITALVYSELPDDFDTEKRKATADIIRAEANKSLPAYSKISKVELVDKPFEKTPKMSIKRFLYH